MSANAMQVEAWLAKARGEMASARANQRRLAAGEGRPWTRDCILHAVQCARAARRTARWMRNGGAR